MKKIFCFCLTMFLATVDLWAAVPLKKPLTFVPSDSIVVWGEDRSDFRNTALSVAPELTTNAVTVSEMDKKTLKKARKVWTQETLPTLDLTGSVIDEQGRIQVVPTADVIKQCGRLFLSTADAQYMNMIERTALNGLMAVATPGKLSFEKHIAAQALMNVSGMTYATDEEGIFVNLYLNSSAHIKTPQLDCVVEQLTAMPHSGRVKLRVGGMKVGLRTFKLRLRMPDWACGKLPEEYHFGLMGTPESYPTVYVNGREEFYHMENGYLVIERRWNSGDEVFFDFPFHAQYLYAASGRAQPASTVALQRGPLVYGFRQPTEDFCYVRKMMIEEAVKPNEYGHSVLAVPVRELKGNENIRWAEPVMDGAYFLWMNVVDKAN